MTVEYLKQSNGQIDWIATFKKWGWGAAQENTAREGLKLDNGKKDWHAFPLHTLEGLIDVAMAGCFKYERFNCLKPFADGDQRFFSAAMRHMVDCQMDPLAVDPETGCLQGYQVAWNMIMRTWHAEQNRSKP